MTCFREPSHLTRLAFKIVLCYSPIKGLGIMPLQELDELVGWFKTNVLNDVYPDSNDTPIPVKPRLSKAQIARREAKEDAKEERLLFKYIVGLD